MNESELSDYLHRWEPVAPTVDWAGLAVASGRRRRRRRASFTAAAVLATTTTALAGVLALNRGGAHTLQTTHVPPTGRSAAALEQVASRELSQIQQGDCADTAASFDRLVASQVSAAQLCAAWVDYTGQFGKLMRTRPPTATKRGRLTVIQIQLELERGNGEYRVTFHPDGTIAGIYFLRAGVPLP